MVARMIWTRKWWRYYREDFELVTSEAVLDELRKGDFPAKSDALHLIEKIPIISIDESIIEITTSYISHHLMPKDPAGDALHLAVASFHKCDFLLTWNCKHLANANKFDYIKRVNVMLGLYVPTLTTPLELLTEDI